MLPLRRLGKILWVIGRYRLDNLVDKTRLPRSARLALSPAGLFGANRAPRGERLRLALEELGPIFIKFGQLLSTRPDLIPEDICREMAQLQDNVPPFSSAVFQASVEAALGASVDEIFAEFETQPLASASIAQVHRATLQDGSPVVVKAVRPNIEKTITEDIQLLYVLARLVANYSIDGTRLRPVDVVRDYEGVITGELNLQAEGANTCLLRHNFNASPLLYVPEVHWPYSNEKVLVMERIEGIPVTDIPALEAAGVNFKCLAERGVEIFFTQVFEHNFFHGDMHPGNIFVDASDPEKPSYLAIDCAIMGSLSREDQFYMARNLLAIFQRDYRQVAELHVRSGWVPGDTSIAELTGAIRAVCEPIFERPLKDISLGHMLINLFSTARRFNMEVQPSLVLLQKTLLNIEGLGRQLYPDLDLWNTAQPFLEKWLRDRYSVKNIYRQFKQHLPDLLEHLPQIPPMLFQALQDMQNKPPPEQVEPKSKRHAIGIQTAGATIAGIGCGLVASHWLLTVGSLASIGGIMVVTGLLITLFR